MSQFIFIQRPERPFEADELQRVVLRHEGLTFAPDELSWRVPSSGEVVALHVLVDRIWTVDERFATDEALDFLKRLAHDLGAEAFCDGRSLTPAPEVPVTPAKFLIALPVAACITLCSLAWGIIRRPWTRWRSRSGRK